MHRKFSATDWFFVAFLLTTVILALVGYWSDNQGFWLPIMENLAYLVVAGIFVNLFRLWRARRILRR